MSGLLSGHGTEALGGELAVRGLVRPELLLELGDDVEEQGRDGAVDLLDERVGDDEARGELLRGGCLALLASAPTGLTARVVAVLVVAVLGAVDGAGDDFGKVLADVALELVGGSSTDFDGEEERGWVGLNVLGEELGEEGVDDFGAELLGFVEELGEDVDDGELDVLGALGAGGIGS